MNYYKEQKDKNGYIYSCDMLRLNFEMRSDCIDLYNAYLENPIRTDITSFPQCFQPYKYRYMYSIDYGEKYGKLALGMVFNGSTSDKYRCFMEFNPNKCMGNPQCEKDIQWLLLNASVVEVARWDLAIDIPVERGLCELRKDKRKYGFEMKSPEDKTEYLGVRNKAGRVKLYNKTVESCLSYDLTRLEITVDSLYLSEVKAHIPDVVIYAAQTSLQFDELGQTDKLLVTLLRQSNTPCLYLRQLEPRKRRKLEPYVIGSDIELSVDDTCIYAIISELKQYCK